MKRREIFTTAQRVTRHFPGAFNNGKSFGGCAKVFTLAATFPNYRVAICRQTLQDLKKTTMQTFRKICPSDMIVSENNQEGI